MAGHFERNSDVTPTVVTRLRTSATITYVHEHNPAKKNTRFGRLKLLAGGVLLAAVGILRLLNGVEVLTHWTGQPLFSWGLIAAGGICILLAVVPSSWVAKVTTARNGKAHSERSSAR